MALAGVFIALDAIKSIVNNFYIAWCISPYAKTDSV